MHPHLTPPNLNPMHLIPQNPSIACTPNAVPGARANPAGELLTEKKATALFPLMPIHDDCSWACMLREKNSQRGPRSSRGEALRGTARLCEFPVQISLRLSK